jgi:hypothetical protein
MADMNFDFLERQIMAVAQRNPSEKALIEAMERLGRESELAAEIARRAESEGITGAMLGVGLFCEDEACSSALARASEKGIRPESLKAFVDYLALRKAQTSWAVSLRHRLAGAASYLLLLVALALMVSIINAGTEDVLVQMGVAEPSHMSTLTWLKYGLLATVGAGSLFILMLALRGSEQGLWRFLGILPAGKRAQQALGEARALALVGIDGQTGVDRLSKDIRRMLRAAMAIGTDAEERLYHQQQAMGRFQALTARAVKIWTIILALLTVSVIFLALWQAYMPLFGAGGSL